MGTKRFALYLNHTLRIDQRPGALQLRDGVMMARVLSDGAEGSYVYLHLSLLRWLNRLRHGTFLNERKSRAQEISRSYMQPGLQLVRNLAL